MTKDKANTRPTLSEPMREQLEWDLFCILKNMDSNAPLADAMAKIMTATERAYAGQPSENKETVYTVTNGLIETFKKVGINLGPKVAEPKEKLQNN